MKTVKLIKLINNERAKASIASVKACTGSSDDICYKKDFAHCSVSSIDICTYDYNACTNYSYDYCNKDI